MTLFVGGVHAVGKSFILRSVCCDLGLKHATASQLIREQRGLESWTTSREVEDIDKNQQALIAATRRLEENGQKVVLDGHFMLRKNVNVHEKIGIDTFVQLNIRAAILLEAPSEVIASRLRVRGDRTWEIFEIEDFSQKEREHADSVCEQLGVSLLRLCSPTILEMKCAVENIFSAH